jgi:hypothetical protein
MGSTRIPIELIIPIIAAIVIIVFLIGFTVSKYNKRKEFENSLLRKGNGQVIT